ncbi:alpha/beta fold hydrolase [Cytobacillus oceanisediminis]|uniref:alpha/beta fold hydrolase n=1 Tax=Cytobacillus oceanisediminis TaxID=665099 RepID=UPI002040E832|nr:alpha/beta hydrolase [Cytobacillus oceanisediminis]MCM3405961.1 alpha/beta hydrolase [Cytobacillus oceanisediminis]
MSVEKNGTLQVPGANIYYQVRGSGPLLLLIHGGGGEAEKYQYIAKDLASLYTVVTYDRRGHSRSILDNPDEDYNVRIQSEDAHHLLSKLTDEPVFVFGSSSGAVIGLELCIRHPEQIQVMITHEPVLLQLLFDEERKQAIKFLEDLRKNHKNEVEKLLSNTYTDTSFSGQTKDEKTELLLNNSTYFVEYEIPGIINYSLNIHRLKNALESTSMKVKPAGGKDSREFFAYQCSVKLSEELATKFIEFPGHHGSYNTLQHKEFAEKLHEALLII